MKSLVTILATVALSGAVLAGPVSYKNPKAPVMPPPPPTGCECFAPGFAFGAFGGGLFDDAEDVLGGGILAEYAFSPYVALQGSYGLYATESEHHQFDAALILRYPITSLCLAPYAMVGGGFSTNSDTSGDFLVGGGLDLRLPSASCMSIFADGAWYVLGDSEDQTIVRLGVKFPF
jgi:hypothetical protein